MAGRSLNKVMLIGNLTRDPVMRYTPNNTAVANFSIATNRVWSPTDGGDKREEVEYHNIVAWSKLAEICNQYVHKGDKLYVEGRLQTREWENKEGQKQRTTEVVMENMVMLGGARGGVSASANEDVSSEQAPVAKPAARKPKKATKAAGSDQDAETSVSDDVAAVEDLADEVDIAF